MSSFAFKLTKKGLILENKLFQKNEIISINTSYRIIWLIDSKNNSFLWACNYKPQLVYFLTRFWKTISLLSMVIFQKILSLCMASILERFLIKSGL